LYLAGPVLIALALYSYAKRYTIWTHFALSGVIGFASLAAWIAIHPASLGWVAVLLMAVVLFWIAGFDIIYACQDVDFDRREGLYSLPARYGIARALLISRLCHVVTVGFLVAVGLVAGFGWLYWAAVVFTAVLLAVEQSLVSATDLSRVNLAFFTINGGVSLLLGAAAITDLILMAPAR
jgi:4-hydroxybenzoate polyprenyltransferase